MPFAAYTIGNGGVFKHNFLTEDGEPATEVIDAPMDALSDAITKWRVYFAGELLATFESEQDAHDYAKFINEQ